jgi:hypothetical protein
MALTNIHQKERTTMGFETDQTAAQELKLTTENDGDIYRQTTTSILKNLATKKASGKYDHDLAVKLFMYLAEAGAKKYAQQFGGVWHVMFPVDVRRQVAAEWRDEFEVEYKNGSYDSMVPKKYQKKAEKPSLGFLVGQRVQTGAHTDWFMMGDRYGDVVKLGKTKVHVKMDRSGKTRLISPRNLEPV